MAYYDPQIHHRRSIRLKKYDYSREGLYYITLCVKDRFHLFGQIINEQMALNEYGEIVKTEWLKIPETRPNIQLGEYIVMPDHFHGIIIIGADSVGAILGGAIHESPQPNESPLQRRKMVLPKIIGRFKMVSSKQINLLRNTPGIPVWQRDYYEHIIRDERAFLNISSYIINNPRNWRKNH
jgi:putative transposase